MWEQKSLGVICENLDKLRVPITKSKRIAGDIPYYGASGIVDYVRDYIFDGNFLLVSEDGANLVMRTYPIAFSISGKNWVNNHAHILKFEHNASQKFIEYFLNSISLESYISGMAQPKLNQKSLNSIKVPFPPLPEQKRIVGILDEAFAGIDQAIANTEKNLQNASDLFESYLNNIFTQKGDGWVEAIFGECFRLRSGDGLTSKKMIDGPYPVFGGNGIAGQHNQYNLSGSNVIIGRVGALCGNARHITEEIWLTDNAFKVTDFNFNFDELFLTYLLNYNNLRSLARQTAQPVISNSSLKDLILCFPKAIEEQQKISSQFKEIEKEAKKLEATYTQKLAALKELKQSLLQKAFAGELTADTQEVA